MKILKPDGLHRIIVSPMWIADDEYRITEPHHLQPGDTVALLFLDFMVPVLPGLQPFECDLIHISNDGCQAPFWGIPFPVLQDGTLDLPLIPPVKVQGKTLVEAWKLIVGGYCVESTILRIPPPLMLSLIRERRPSRRGVAPKRELASGDLLCIAGLPGRRKTLPGFHFPEDPSLAPCFGELLPVLPDGTLLLPGAGRVQTHGRSIDELEDAIARRYNERELFDNHQVVIVRLARRQSGE